MPVAFQILSEEPLPPTISNATNATKRKHAANNNNDSPEKPDPVEQQRLLMPSELSAEQRASCYAGLEDIERDMRDAQCRTALDHVRTQLYIKSRLLTYKDRHVRHQGASTRTRSIIDERDIKIKILRDKYNRAREALVVLADADAADVEWVEMTEADMRCLEDPEEDKKREQWAANRLAKQKKNKESELEVPGPGEGHRKVSWIWEGAGRDPDTSTGMHEGKNFLFQPIPSAPLTSHTALRVEWAKARARSLRWSEEVALLKEEMRRVLLFLENRAKWWTNLAYNGNARPADLSEGVTAYALGQAQVQLDMAAKFEALWSIARRDELFPIMPVTQRLPAVRESNLRVEESEDELDGAGEGSEEEEMEALDDDEDGYDEFTRDD